MTQHLKIRQCVKTVAWLATCLSLFCTARGSAQEDASTIMARERFKEGVNFFDSRQYEKARAAFLQAYALRKHPAVLLNLAQSELRCGHEAEAARRFSQFLREDADLSPTERQNAEAGLAQARTAVSEVTITSDVDGAELFVNGNFEGRTPLPGPLYLTPGSQRFELVKEGKSKSATLLLHSGQSVTHPFEFHPRVNTSKPRTGKPNQNAPILFPPSQQPASPAASSRKPFFVWVANNPIAWVGSALTLIGISSGAGFAIGAHTKYRDANHIADAISTQAVIDSNRLATSDGVCTDPYSWLRQVNFPGNVSQRADHYTRACQDYIDYVHSADTMKTLSIAGWAVGGAAAATTVAYYFASPSAKETPTNGGASFRPILLPVFSKYVVGFNLQGQY